jgi:hypothetical protein
LGLARLSADRLPLNRLLLLPLLRKLPPAQQQRLFLLPRLLKETRMPRRRRWRKPLPMPRATKPPTQQFLPIHT